jgi:hypothetical protein
MVTLTIQVVVAGMLAAGGTAAEPVLVVAAEGKTEAVVVVSPEAGLPESKGQDGNAVRGLDAGGKRNHEWLAAADLVKYIENQGMLVWRGIPNPSHQGLKQDFAHYAKAGILGVNTESRNAIATTFLNLFFRGRLMWNPSEDVDALLQEFYPKFYGPAAVPMELGPT